MIKSYFQNAQVSMTKEHYYEMCEALGTEPDPEQIPVDLEDFPPEVQDIFLVYYRLKDDWDTMNGVYQGKSYVGLIDVLNILEVPTADRRMVLDWLGIMDSARKEVMNANKAQTKTPGK